MISVWKSYARHRHVNKIDSLSALGHLSEVVHHTLLGESQPLLGIRVDDILSKVFWNSISNRDVVHECLQEAESRQTSESIESLVVFVGEFQDWELSSLIDLVYPDCIDLILSEVIIDLTNIWGWPGVEERILRILNVLSYMVGLVFAKA